MGAARETSLYGNLIPECWACNFRAALDIVFPVEAGVRGESHGGQCGRPCL